MNNMFQGHLGNDWFCLHPNIQERFAQDPQEDGIHYAGKIDAFCSRLGRLFAYVTYVIGNPLTPFCGKDVPLDVSLFKKPKKDGVYWQRIYHFRGKKPYKVTSVKKTGSKGEMLECVGGGFGMVLKAYAQNRQLHLKSMRYFWQYGRFRLYLPHFITPGQTHVVHSDLGDGRFQFTITMNHPWFGATFHQNGIFKRKDA